MYYLLSVLLFGILYYVFVKILGSLIKGCLITMLVVIVAYVAIAMIRSTKEPVTIFDLYQIDNLNIRKL